MMRFTWNGLDLAAVSMMQVFCYFCIVGFYSSGMGALFDYSCLAAVHIFDLLWYNWLHIAVLSALKLTDVLILVLNRGQLLGLFRSGLQTVFV